MTCSFLETIVHTFVSLAKLGKPDLARLVMDYQNKFDIALYNMKYWI